MRNNFSDSQIAGQQDQARGRSQRGAAGNWTESPASFHSAVARPPTVEQSRSKASWPLDNSPEQTQERRDFFVVQACTNSLYQSRHALLEHCAIFPNGTAILIGQCDYKRIQVPQDCDRFILKTLRNNIEVLGSQTIRITAQHRDYGIEIGAIRLVDEQIQFCGPNLEVIE